MSTKASLLSSINAQITAVITQAKHRLAMSFLVEELYPQEITEIHSSVVQNNSLIITQPTDPNIFYNISFVKRGNTVFLNGVVSNLTGSMYAPSFLQVTNPEYYAKTWLKYYGVTSNNGIVTINFDDDNRWRAAPLPPNDFIIFSLTYQTND